MRACEAGETQPAAAVCQGLSLRFGNSIALDSVSLQLDSGEVHGIVGPNGAGKSSLMGILSGRLKPSAGCVLVDGIGPLALGHPATAQSAGIAIVHQELTLLRHRSVLENVFLGRPISRMGIIRKQAMIDRLQELQRLFDADLNPSAVCGELSVAEQQVVEIIRALNLKPRILILDEPTAPLAEAERRALLKAMMEIREGGTALVFVSHNLDEVLEICDRVTVLRGGRVVESRATQAWDKPGLVESMLSRQLLEAEHKQRGLHEAACNSAQPLLEVHDLTVGATLKGVSFTLKEGEVLGVGGLVGSGRSTLLRALAGAEGKATSGALRLSGNSWPFPESPRRAIQAGIAMVPEDRKQAGLILNMTAYDNVTATGWKAISKGGFLRRAEQKRIASVEASRTGFSQLERLGEPPEVFSGGNQQKLVIAKWLWRRPKVLLCDEPTRGIDVGAKEEVLNLVRQLAGEGVGVLFVSSALEEVVAISDRVIVLRNGELAGELVGDKISEENILALAFANDVRYPSPEGATS